MDKRQILDVICDFLFVLLMLVGSLIPPSGLGVTRRAGLLARVTMSDALAGRPPRGSKTLGGHRRASRRSKVERAYYCDEHKAKPRPSPKHNSFLLEMLIVAMVRKCYGSVVFYAELEISQRPNSNFNVW